MNRFRSYWKSTASCLMGIACLVCIVVGLGRFSDAFLFISIACGLLAVFFATEKGWRSKIAVALLAISIGGWMFSPVFRDGFSLASLILAFVAYSYTTEELGSKIGVGLSALTILIFSAGLPTQFSLLRPVTQFLGPSRRTLFMHQINRCRPWAVQLERKVPASFSNACLAPFPSGLQMAILTWFLIPVM